MRQWLQQIGHSVCLVSSLWCCTDKERLPKLTNSTSFTLPALRAKAVHARLSSHLFELTGQGPDGHLRQVYTLRHISSTPKKGFVSTSDPSRETSSRGTSSKYGMSCRKTRKPCPVIFSSSRWCPFMRSLKKEFRQLYMRRTMEANTMLPT